MAKHDVTAPVDQRPQRHFDEVFTYRIASILAELEESRFDDVGVYVPEAAVADLRRTCDRDEFGGWPTGKSEPRPNSWNDASAGKRHHADGSGEAINYVTSNIQNARTYKQHGKPLEVHYYGASVCKACVEPTTYCYVTNNGCYRSSKALIQNLGCQRASKKLADARMLNPEQKRLQKEIQRELRREFGLTEERNRNDLEERERNRKSLAYRAGHGERKRKEEEEEEEGSPTDEVIDDDSQEDDRGNEKVVEATDSEIGVGRPPLVLPAIAVPLVSTDGCRSNGVDMSCLLSRLDAFKESSSKNSLTTDLRRTKRGLYLGARSRSEPPPAAIASVTRTSSGLEENGLIDLQVVPTTLKRDVTSSAMAAVGMRTSAAIRRENTARHEGEVLRSNREGDGWIPGQTACQPIDDATVSVSGTGDVPNTTVAAAAATANEKRKHSDRSTAGKNSSSSLSDSASDLCSQDAISLTQIRYMAASGEVSNAPKFGRSSDDLPTANVYSSLDVNRNAMATTFRTSMPNKHAAKDSPSPKRKTRVASTKNNTILSDLNPGKLGAGGFRAFPVGQMKITDKNPTEPDLDILPKISGRKITMAVTSHRIV